jgi:hypothetical protein
LLLLVCGHGEHDEGVTGGLDEDLEAINRSVRHGVEGND